MKTLFTITGNLLAEYTFNTKPFKTGETVRAESSSFQVGGKGVNVSQAAQILGLKSEAIIFAAGIEGQKCKNCLAAEKLAYKAFEIDGNTRTGLVVRANNAETTFLGKDIPVLESAFKKAVLYIKKAAKKNDIVALCGSFPGWKDSFGELLLKICKEKNLVLCADTYGKPLNFFAFCNSTNRLGILKMNKKELLGLFDKKVAYKKAFEKLVSTNCAKIFAVTNGGENSYICENGKIFENTPKPAKKIVSATGCGDIVFASLIKFIYCDNTPAKKAFETAQKIASHSAQSPKLIDIPKKYSAK